MVGISQLQNRKFCMFAGTLTSWCQQSFTEHSELLPTIASPAGLSDLQKKASKNNKPH